MLGKEGKARGDDLYLAQSQNHEWQSRINRRDKQPGYFDTLIQQSYKRQRG